MVCHICTREFSTRRKPVCPSCAQATLYEPRIEQATALLDREKAHAHVEAILRAGNDGVLAALPQDADFDAIENGIRIHSLERIRSETDTIEERINSIAEYAVLLRQQIEAYKSHAADQKKSIQRRKLDNDARRRELDTRKPQDLEPLRKSERRNARRLEKVHSRTIDARAYLCHKAAELSGLKGRVDEQGRLTRKHELGGIPVADLRELNGQHEKPQPSPKPKHSYISKPNNDEDHEPAAFHAQTSASLDNVCRLVGLWCHYLSIRLPAEVIMPHNDFPHSVIMPEKSSYKTTHLPFPGLSYSQSSSPAASRALDLQNLPRPRLLHLDRPLQKLAKDDPKTYGLFLESVVLLSHDLAWLCKSQGINTVNTFDDMCNIGKNLWQLFETQRKASTTRPRLDRNISTATDITSYPTKGSSPGPAIRFGAFSHASTHRSLSSHEGLELFKDWKLPPPARLTDKLRAYLLTDMTGAEWDLMEDKEWEKERDDELAVLVGGERRSLAARNPAMSVMIVTPQDGVVDDAADGKPKGSSGWMKVRGRSEDG